MSAATLAPHRIEPTILREYDIRGIVGETLTIDDAHAIARSFGTRIVRDGGTRVCVGYDGRLSSPDIEAAVVDALVACGLRAVRVGLGPTPMLYFAVNTTGADAGIMISGSHNPPEYNGFKLLTSSGSFYGDDIQDLGAIAASGAFAAGTGSAEDQPMLDAYVERVHADYRAGRDDRELHVAWDAGNGSAGQAMEMLYRRPFDPALSKQHSASARCQLSIGRGSVKRRQSQ